MIAVSQSRGPIELTWAELTDTVRRCAAGLRRLGVGAGDRVVGYAPNIPETLIGFLASASLGAVWSSVAPEFGVRSVTDRFSQIEPSVLIAIDGYRYGAKSIDRAGHVAEIVDALASLRHVIHVPYLEPSRGRRPRRGNGPVWHAWDEVVDADDDPDVEASSPLTFAPVPADHPLYVLFSSGTTGLPKAIVHGHGGIVAEHLKVLDLPPGPRSRGTLLLVLDHRLDDVELLRVRAAHRLGGRVVRRRSRYARLDDAVASRR